MGSCTLSYIVFVVYSDLNTCIFMDYHVFACCCIVFNVFFMNRSGAQKKKPPHFPTLGGVAGQGGGVAVQGGVGVAGQGGGHSSEKWGLFMF